MSFCAWTGSEAGLPEGRQEALGQEALTLGVSSLRRYGSIHSPIRKFRERNGIDATNIENTTFFPIEPCSLGCRYLRCFGTETAPWVSGLAWQSLRFGLESHQFPETNGETRILWGRGSLLGSLPSGLGTCSSVLDVCLQQEPGLN